ncbi:MAG: Curli production assembly/transport component CsgG [bacterium ADurb.Bin429]|nr:MAG: Curli production assembly/transport component CsgG [bacterium ADurb.Bin429]
MRALRFIVVVLVTLFILGMQSVQAQGPGTLTSGERPFNNENAHKVTGDTFTFKGEVTIAGRLFNSYGYVYSGWGTFNISGWDYFVAHVGISDNNSGNGEVIIETDGVQVYKQQINAGDQAITVSIPLNGRRTITLRAKRHIIFAEPKLYKGKTPSAQPTTPGTTTTVTVTGTPATFAIDPNDLEKLATALRKRIDGRPELAARVARGKVALMTFSLVDITSASIATNVAEDLSTSMINNDFQLIERGQLDKVLKELKVQDTALIDPATAQKLGQLTGCDMILVGSISDRGQFVVINSRLLETATGKALAAERVEMRKIEIKR